MGDVQDSQSVSASEMTYIVSGGALNSTNSTQATSSMGTVNKNSSYSPVGPCLSLFFRLHDLSLCWCMFCFTLDSWVISLHVLALA